MKDPVGPGPLFDVLLLLIVAAVIALLCLAL